MTRVIDRRGTRVASPCRVLLTSVLFAGALGSAAIFAVGITGAAARPATATAARTLSLNETGHLRLTNSKGLTLNEKGTVSGTIKGSIYIHLTVSSSNRVTAEVSIYPKGGSLSGRGSANYHVSGANALFSGTLAISRGSGSYAHAHASGLRFTGTIQRKTDAVTVHVSGPLAV